MYIIINIDNKYSISYIVFTIHIYKRKNKTILVMSK